MVSLFWILRIPTLTFDLLPRLWLTTANSIISNQPQPRRPWLLLPSHNPRWLSPITRQVGAMNQAALITQSCWLRLKNSCLAVLLYLLFFCLSLVMLFLSLYGKFFYAWYFNACGIAICSCLWGLDIKTLENRLLGKVLTGFSRNLAEVGWDNQCCVQTVTHLKILFQFSRYLMYIIL